MTITKEQKRILRVGVAMAIAVALAVGFTAGNFYGAQRQAREVWKILELTSATPQNNCQDGDATVTVDPPVIWQRMCGRLLSYRPLPPSDAVWTVRLFGPPTPAGVPQQQPPASPTTTTLAPKGDKP
jgi:hypothetical protein